MTSAWWYLAGLAPLAIVTVLVVVAYLRSRPRAPEPAVLESSAPRDAVRAAIERRSR